MISIPAVFIQPTPVGDKQCDRLGYPLHGFQLDTFIEAVNRLGGRAVDQRRSIRVETEETSIGCVDRFPYP